MYEQLYEQLSLAATVLHCFADQAFMVEYRRLTGDRIGTPISPVEMAVDVATGHPGVDEAEARRFFEFVRAHIWTPLYAEVP